MLFPCFYSLDSCHCYAGKILSWNKLSVQSKFWLPKSVLTEFRVHHRLESCEGQNLCWLSLSFIIYLRVLRPENVAIWTWLREADYWTPLDRPKWRWRWWKRCRSRVPGPPIQCQRKPPRQPRTPCRQSVSLQKANRNVCQKRIFHVGLFTKDVHSKGGSI